MGYPTKLQLISRKQSEQYYINIPAALAQALDFTKGENLQWVIHDRSTLVVLRPDAPPSPLDQTVSSPPEAEEKKTPSP
jgi:antitoxin component of MazEF toxin-antitoxin module